MTIEELRAEAKKLGYNLIPAPTYENLLPCKCGGKRRSRWYTPKGVYLECIKCGFAAPIGKTEAEARRNWNEAIKNG